MSIFSIIVSYIKKEYEEEFSGGLSRDDFFKMIYNKSFGDTRFWMNLKNFFIGSTTTFENLQINDSTNYPFKGVVNDEFKYGGEMASFQQLGMAGEYKCNELLYTGGNNKTLNIFFNIEETVYRPNEGKLLWHDGRRQDKTIEPWSIEDYYMLFSATPDIIGLKKEINDLESDVFIESKIDVIKNHDLLKNVVEIKSSLIDENVSCDVRNILIATTRVDEQAMFYQLIGYKSSSPIVNAIESHVNSSIIYYYEEKMLLAQDNHVNLSLTNPRVHNAIYAQAVNKIVVDDECYDSKYVVTCESSEFRCEFDIPKNAAVEFVNEANKKFVNSKGLRKIIFRDASYSSEVRQYIFQNKSNTCKNFFQQTKTKKHSDDDIYDRIKDELYKNVQVLLIPSLDLTQARIETDIHDIRLNPRCGYINQLLREMIASLNLIDRTRTDMTGYLLLPSLSSYKKTNVVEYNLHSLLAFKFVVPVEILCEFRDEIVFNMIDKTYNIIDDKSSLKLSKFTLHKISFYRSQLSRKAQSRTATFVKRRKTIKKEEEEE